MNKKYNIYSIHYSCSGFHNGGAVAPTICCIALYNILNLLKTDLDKEFIIQAIEQGKTDINLLELLAYEYMNSKKVA